MCSPAWKCKRELLVLPQVRKLLEVVQCKGERACEYLLHVISTVHDAYVDLQPWLKDIRYAPSRDVALIEVVNTDPSEYRRGRSDPPPHTHTMGPGGTKGLWLQSAGTARS